MYYLLMPFTWLLTLFYHIFSNYGVALFFFALVVKLILFPVSLKGKRSMIQMNLLNGQLKKLQKQFGNDKQRYQMEVQKLYEKEGVNPMGGCLWTLVPLFILIPLYAILRQPLQYMMGLAGDQIDMVASVLKDSWTAAAQQNGWATVFNDVGYNQLYLSSLINPENLARVQAAVGEAGKSIFSINFSFLGVNMAMVPALRFWQNESVMTGFGLFMVPVVSAATSVLFSIVTTKTNSMNNPEAAAATNKSMMLLSPLLSLWIGFNMPAALSLYWISNNILGMIQEVVSGRMLKKDYERAAEEAKRRAIEEKEEEKRLRREKAEQRAREAEEARKNRGKKKPAGDQAPDGQKGASREGMRQYARGRAYDPGRYGGVTPYHDGKATIETAAAPAPMEAAETPAPTEDDGSDS